MLDTAALKQSPLTVRIDATHNGDTRSASLQLIATAAEQDWVDVAIDSAAKAVTVELRLEVKDGGAEGVGELPPQEVQNFPT